MVNLKNQITTFAQRDDGVLYEWWEQFKDLLRLCFHHELQKWMIMQTFYNGVTQLVRFVTAAATGGTLMDKKEDKAINLIEEMARNNL